MGWLWLVCLTVGADTAGWQFYATDRAAYRGFVDATVARTGHSSACIRSTPAAISRSFGLYWQRIDAHRYRGHRVRLSGYLRTTGVSGRAGMWLRVDPKDGPTLEFDNKQERPIVGSTGWKQYFVELNVSAQAEEIHFGALLVGSGEVWFDDVEIKAVGPYLPGAEEARRAGRCSRL